MKRLALFLSLFLSFSLFAANPQFGKWGVDLDGMDRTVKPGDDFNRYVNGVWMSKTQIPGDKTEYGAFEIVDELAEARVHTILDRWTADKNLKSGSDQAKVAAIYRSFLDDAAVEKLDAKPVEPLLDAVKKAKTREDIAKLMGIANGTFGSNFAGAAVIPDLKHPDLYALYLGQSGLGLPDREFYLRDTLKPQKERYQKYVADMLRLIGWDEPEKNAADIVAMETKIAEAHWTRAESRDRNKIYNPMTVAELEKSAPDFPWQAYFAAAGFDKADRVIVAQNTAMPKIAKVFGDAPVPALQAWSAFHIIDQAAPYLSKRFVDTAWEFRSKFLNGTTEQRPRWKRAVSAADGAMGEAIGREFVSEYFPPESKAKMEALVHDLLTAMKGRIDSLQWMEPETKTRALEKLSKFGVKIGYPSKWRDYAKLEIKDGDVFGNALRSSKFEWDRGVNRVGKAVDRTEWSMTPQTVNAYYYSPQNEIVFPAAILQPPFFDPNADAAVNYGAIGAVIGHEITHGFDDQGRKSDGDGVLRDWWEAADATKFDSQATKLGSQYEAVDFNGLPGIHINGKATMGENIADLGGLLLALDAYKVSLGGKPAPVLDGFTGEQRVFLGFGQVWRTLQRQDALRQQLMTNPHSPGDVRAFAPLRNVDAWYAAFGVKEGDKNYVKPEERVRIW
ncbi:MAG TPA: M13-type metalloendopeptidase [Thermoanaerobaculia bacterium]|nr:M13-type metalloendopeptidase [Thermoanaerobaculia bacterium]